MRTVDAAVDTPFRLLNGRSCTSLAMFDESSSTKQSKPSERSLLTNGKITREANVRIFHELATEEEIFTGIHEIRVDACSST